MMIFCHFSESLDLYVVNNDNDHFHSLVNTIIYEINIVVHGCILI